MELPKRLRSQTGVDLAVLPQADRGKVYLKTGAVQVLLLTKNLRSCLCIFDFQDKISEWLT